MTRRAQIAIISGVLTVAVFTMAAGFPTKTVPPKQWAKGVCTAVGNWVDLATDGAKELKADLKGKNVKPAKVRSALSKYLGDIVDATDQTLDDIKDSGTPATPQGKQAVNALTSGFEDVHTSMQRLHRQATRISIVNRATALADVRALQEQVSAEFTALEATFNAMSPYDPGQKISKAFTATKACQALSDG